MKMRSIVLVLIATIVLMSCENTDNKLVIKGKLENGAGKQIVLNKVIDNALEVLDSANLADDGSFKLVADIKHHDYYVIGFRKTHQFIEVIGGPGDMVEITGDASKMMATAQVKGSKETQDVLDLYAKLFTTQKEINDLGMEMREKEKSMPGKSDSLRKEFISKARELNDAHLQYSLKFIEENKTNLASLAAVAQQETQRKYVIDPVKNFDILVELDTILIAKHPNSLRVKQLNNYIKRQKAVKEMEKHTAIGATAPDIALPDQNGNEIKLSSLRGKWVLLDFWAAWCRPCRAENPNLVKMYKQFKNKNFEIYQVSLDEKVDNWTDAIFKDELNWVQVCDFKKWESPAARLYNINSIPANFLIDPDGKIVEKNLRGNLLEIKLKKYMY